jgi:hypothetical protein
MAKKMLSILSVCVLIAAMSSCGGGGGVSSPTGSGSSDKLVAISITPTNPTIAKDTAITLTATGIYSDNTTQDLTGSVTWTSSDSTVATTSSLASTSSDPTTAQLSNGKAYAYGKQAGKTTITATSGNTSGSTTLTVTNAVLVSLAIAPANPSIAKGTNQQFSATGTFSDNTTQILTTQVVWSSSNTGIAAISSSGLATSIAAGSTTISATSGSISRTSTLSVTSVTTTGSATLSWAAPTTNTDGTPLTNLAGYKIYYGTSSGNYTLSQDIGNITSYTINNLPSGTYYFAVTSYDSSGMQSVYSNEARKTIQ